MATADASNVASAGIKTLDYVDPWRQAPSDPLYTSDDSSFAHDCNGNRISIAESSTTTQYLMNPAAPSLLTLLNNWEAGQAGIGHIDAFFFDDTDAVAGLSSLGCSVSQGVWDAATAALIAGTSHPVVFNGYATSSDAAALIGSSNAIGAMAEQCYGTESQPTPPYTTGPQWTQSENLEIAAAAAGKQFFCYNNVTTDGASATAVRQYIYASFLLTYSPASSVLWETFGTPSGLHVFPETQLVPANPLVTAPGSVSDLEASSGVYVREYGACFIGGKSAGACAAVVNPDPSTHAMPSFKQTYAHTMSLSGGGVLDGGSLSSSGGAPPSSLPAQSALVLFR
ncbi:MAG: hypothetical protein ACRENA_04485 [Vulcanimicrobiaceae bacterium]